MLVAMLGAEWLATASIAALVVDLALFAVFVALVPGGFRISRALGSIAGPLAYGALGIGLVTTFGILLPRALGLPGTYVADPLALGVVLVLVLVGGWGLGRDIELEAGWDAERTRGAQLALEAERARILALRAQLDPHFLFNTLNAIAELCREDAVRAESATLRLARILRTIHDGIRAPTWPLGAELELLRSLFELHEIRDRERYRLELDLPDPPPDAEVPPMLLLPLFENAITHGPSAGHAGPVVLRARAGAGTIEVEIRNPGAFRGRREGGEGIAIVERRIALAYGDRAHLSVRAEDGATVAELRLPRAPIAEEVAR